MNTTHVVEQQAVVDMYNKWSNHYEKEVEKNYAAPEKLAEAVSRHVPDKSASFLDVAAGTGLVAESLIRLGYTGNFDALDPATGFAEKAKERNLYKEYYHEFITEEPCSLPSDKYDNITVCGGVVPGHIHYKAIVELLRMIKKGGKIFIAMRHEYTKTEGQFLGMDEYLVEMEKLGKLKTLEKSTYENHYIHYEGLILVLEKQ